MKTCLRNQRSTAQAILFEVSAELQALAYLFETQGAKGSPITSTDKSQVGHGLGRIIKRQVLRLRQVRSVVEKL